MRGHCQVCRSPRKNNLIILCTLLSLQLVLCTTDPYRNSEQIPPPVGEDYKSNEFKNYWKNDLSVPNVKKYSTLGNYGYPATSTGWSWTWDQNYPVKSYTKVLKNRGGMMSPSSGWKPMSSQMEDGDILGQLLMLLGSLDIGALMMMFFQALQGLTLFKIFAALKSIALILLGLLLAVLLPTLLPLIQMGATTVIMFLTTLLQSKPVGRNGHDYFATFCNGTKLDPPPTLPLSFHGGGNESDSSGRQFSTFGTNVDLVFPYNIWQQLACGSS